MPSNLENRIREVVIERDRLKRNLDQNRKSLDREKKVNVRLLEARKYLLAFASKLQSDFSREVEGLLTMAVRSVYSDRDYKFELDFKERKDRIDIIPNIVEGKLSLIPNKDARGGILPVIGFPLRVILLGDRRRLIWMDEPLKGSLGRSDEQFFRAIQMFKEISEKAGIQVILNTHEEDFVPLANTVHRVSYKDGNSTIKRIKPMRQFVRR